MYVHLLSPYVCEYQIDMSVYITYSKVRTFIATHVCEYQIDMSVYINIL